MAELLLAGSDTPERIVDPSAGGGTLLLAVAHLIAGGQPDRKRLADTIRRLHGVELDPVARELCCLQLWLASAGTVPIGEIAVRIHHDNAITRAWADHDPYDGLIMNPPWDSLRHTVEADDNQRRRTIHRLENAHTVTASLPPLYRTKGAATGTSIRHSRARTTRRHRVRQGRRARTWRLVLRPRHPRTPRPVPRAYQYRAVDQLREPREVLPDRRSLQFGILSVRRDPRRRDAPYPWDGRSRS